MFLACYHPIKAFYRLREDGKKDICFSNVKGETVGLDYKGNVFPYPIDIPCGQCMGCRLEYSRQWATRCVLESLKYEHNYFITLTYSPEHLPVNDCFSFSEETGEVFYEFESASLVPEHLTKFLKDLRRYFEYHFNFTGIRFFACGEYGSKLLRPHYHLILFNCPIPDLKLLKTSFNGDCYYESDIISKIWNKGFVCVGSCNFATCSYVARYMLKKQKGQNAVFYDNNCLVPPFTRCSRMPGIGREYYDENKDVIYTYDKIIIAGSDGKAKKVRPPSYFDKLYDIDSPEELKKIKDMRKLSAENSIKRKLEHTSLDRDTYLAVSEEVFNSKINKLIRPVE